MGLGVALGTLLGVQSPEQQETLARLQAASKQMRWKSAIAIGEKDGLLVMSHVSAESRSNWANDRALAFCKRQASTPCSLLMSDGQFVEAGLLEVAHRLGGRRQAVVRDDFIAKAQRALKNGM